MTISNHWTGIGRLTRDPQVRFLTNEKAVADFGLACSRKYKTAGGEQREETLFIDCDAWGKLAEIIGKYCTKGKEIAVSGELKLDQWEDKSGNKRSKIKCVVSEMKLLGSAGGNNDSGTKHEGGESPRGHAEPVDDEPPF